VITLTNTLTNQVFTAVISSSGAFTFANLPAGTYTLSDMTTGLNFTDTVGSLGGSDNFIGAISNIVVGQGSIGTGYAFVESGIG
jgi:hypothetical protein